MSLSKTGLRKITVDDQQYEWTIRQRDTSGQNYETKKLKAAIQLVTDAKRGLLMVDFGVSPPHTWRNPHKTAITPKLIEKVIRIALEDGWNPLTTGNYEMRHQVEFIPDSDSPSGEHALYDIRWDR
jgi:hypothetical protein